MDIAFTDAYDPAYKDTNSKKFKDQSKKIEDALLLPIQAKLPEVDKDKVLALTQGSTIATINMIMIAYATNGAVEATDVGNILLAVLENLNVEGLTPDPNQKITVDEDGNYLLYYLVHVGY